ncbi:hypothetical protein B0J18DRAFT_465810 [Chaetomium sp. MPI-SDFR-AT-0129]|nr:hypothetical protein B0J18DRAFT_465810 [Chaetomium sp. MPI-SDFR-AT-0129]
MATNGNLNHDQHVAAPAQTTEVSASAEATNSPLPKDEVGWYFVEQYYTTMSRSPDRLHLYYGKKAQFVCGREAEVVNVSFGRQSIQERIKGMNFQDCKVRISNVDTQGSEENILITVIGEMANQDGEPKKFVQTFVLAQQPSGYFVLNDMLRFLNEDVEEDVEAGTAEESSAPVEMPAAPEPESKAEVVAAEKAAEEAAEKAAGEPEAALDTQAVDEKLEATEETPAVQEPAAAKPAVEVHEAAAEEPKATTDAEKAAEEIAEEEAKKPEEPKDPAPTPAAAPVPVRAAAAAPAPAQPEKPKGPPKPMSWASRVAAAATVGAPKPAVPAVKAATPPAPAQTRAPVPAAPQQAAPAAQPQESATAPAAPKDQGSEWQTAETKRQSRAQPPAAVPSEKEGTMAYIKYVTDKVKEEDLKTTLSAFGDLAYFDVNRLKNCAFVEFKSLSGYTAAIAASPLTVNGESVVVEQRRPKANAYGGANYNTPRGGPGRGGRGGYEPSRSGSQGGGRGGFTGQSRGRGGGPRGRGASQIGAA